MAAHTDARYTTAGLLECEQPIIGSADRRALDGAGCCARGCRPRTVAPRGVAQPRQVAAVRALTSGGRGIDVVDALAGTGKTTMIAALAACYRIAGWHVIGTAPTGRAARQLRETAQIPATTMHTLSAELDEPVASSANVLVIDEAGMAPTRITAQLLRHAERAGVKVIAVGDPGQLGSVEAGGWLAALSRRHPGPGCAR